MSLAIVAEHLGHLTPLEQTLILLVSIVPFVVLAVVVVVVRARDLREDDEQEAHL